MTEPSSNPARPPLDGKSLVTRLAVLGAIVGGLAMAFAYAGGWLTPHKVTATTIVNTLEQGARGQGEGFRRNHAKGVAFHGRFEGSGKATQLSTAALFAQGTTPVVGRFALAGQQPYVADDVKTVRSMAVEFDLTNGEVWRSGMNDIPVFPVRDGVAFYDLSVATAPDPKTGKLNPDKMREFLAKHPESGPALKQIGGRKVSSGFDNDTYWSLNAFEFVAADGKVTPVRWAMVPVQPFVAAPVPPPLPAENADAASTPTPTPSQPVDKNAVFDALIAAAKDHPLQWKLVATIGQPSDKTSDATLAWPADRDQVELGTLTIEGLNSEETSRVRDINFDPLVLPAGIRGSDDPILSARSAAYALSHQRREGEPKQPSAVTSAEVHP